MKVRIEDMTIEQLRYFLKLLIEKLNELDNDDFFGTEGWRHFMGFE